MSRGFRLFPTSLAHSLEFGCQVKSISPRLPSYSSSVCACLIRLFVLTAAARTRGDATDGWNFIGPRTTFFGCSLAHSPEGVSFPFGSRLGRSPRSRRAILSRLILARTCERVVCFNLISRRGAKSHGRKLHACIKYAIKILMPAFHVFVFPPTMSFHLERRRPASSRSLTC